MMRRVDPRVTEAALGNAVRRLTKRIEALEDRCEKSEALPAVDERCCACGGCGIFAEGTGNDHPCGRCEAGAARQRKWDASRLREKEERERAEYERLHKKYGGKP